MPRIRMESGPRGVDHITIPHEKMRESGWEVGDEVTFNWDGKRMILTKLPKQVAVSKIPAEVEIPTVEKSAQESPDKATPLSGQGYNCPICNTPVHDIESKCRSCGASLLGSLRDRYGGLVSRTARIAH